MGQQLALSDREAEGLASGPWGHHGGNHGGGGAMVVAAAWCNMRCGWGSWGSGWMNGAVCHKGWGPGMTVAGQGATCCWGSGWVNMAVCQP